MNSQAIVLGSMIVVTIDSGVKTLLDDGSRVPQTRIVIGGFLVTIGLLMLSEAAPKVAEGMAILILAAELFGPTGGGLAKTVKTVTSKAPQIVGANPTSTQIPGIRNVLPNIPPATTPQIPNASLPRFA